MLRLRLFFAHFAKNNFRYGRQLVLILKDGRKGPLKPTSGLNGPPSYVPRRATRWPQDDILSGVQKTQTAPLPKGLTGWYKETAKWTLLLDSPACAGAFVRIAEIMLSLTCDGTHSRK